MAIHFRQVKALGNHPAIAVPRAAYAKHRYSTPVFVLRETLNAFRLHNGFSISASLSFYALFALIPMALLMFFMLSHLIVSSNSAIVKLAILTGTLVPKFSHRIMIEVYNISKHGAVWGIFGFFILFWIVTPLAGALRAAFHTIAARVEAPSFIKRKIKDVLAVIGILALFLIFTFLGLMTEKLIGYIEPSTKHTALITSISSIIFSTLLMAMFYRFFFPARIALKHILIGSIVTGLLWLAMRPAFTLFLSLSQSYGSVFGGMKNMFVSIVWLYYTFIVFLLGTELIATLHKKDVLLLKGLFNEMPDDKAHYLNELMTRYGKTYKAGDYIYKEGDEGHEIYYVVDGQLQLIHQNRILRDLNAGDYFGEMAFLTGTARYADAKVSTDHTRIIVISAENIETLLSSDPNVALNFLKEMATRLQETQLQSNYSNPKKL
ncbi:MAG TPA: YhjD/YihY/BrkB family envelope integrity protein [Methyloradius sp.]